MARRKLALLSKDPMHHTSPAEACIEAASACARACDHCAIACLGEEDPKAMAECIQLDLDCAAACRFTAMLLARSSAHAAGACTLCAEIAEACAQECGRHDMDHCQRCAQACRACARACRAMAF